MKKLFIALVAIATFASCKKETLDTLVPVVAQEPVFSKNVKTSSYSYNGSVPEIENFSFDAQGRIISYKKEYPGSIRIQTFDYATAGKIFSTYTNNGIVTTTYECSVNNQGYITANIIKNAAGALVYTYNYTYDANGYMVKSASTNAAGITDHVEYKIEGGNLIERKLYYNGVLSNTGKYTYDLTKYNCFKYSYGANWAGVGFGKSSKNLISNYQETNASGTVTWNINYNYQLNASGYAETRNYTESIHNYSGVETYTFQ